MKTYTSDEIYQKSKLEKRITTSCRDCYFGQKRGNEEGGLDCFCKSGRLTKFHEAGTEIVNVHSEQKNKIFKLIFGRICNLLRSPGWAEARIEGGTAEEDLVRLAREEVKLTCTFIVYAKSEEDLSQIEDEKERRQAYKKKVESVFETMKSIDEGINPPSQIVVINNCKIPPYDFSNYLRRICKIKEINCSWYVQTMTESYVDRAYDSYDDKDLAKKRMLYECVDKAIKSSTNMYYCIFRDGYIVPDDYLSSIDSFLNDKLIPFIAIIPDKDGEVNGLFVQKLAHTTFSGNQQIGLIEKLRESSEEQKCTQMIKRLSEVKGL